TAQSYASLVIGRYNVKEGSTTSWVSSDPLFVAGNGTTDGTRSNALILYKNGDMTIKGNFTEGSDIRLKKNISRLSGTLEKINRINPVSFEFKNTNTHPAGTQIGLIAQEVQKVFPELVSEGAHGYLSVNYTKLTAVLLEAIKEQQKVIDRQDTENREMKERIFRLESLNNLPVL
ncbi:MAG: tail fiber domain-containing protein, partial [Chlorobi bacterium]|nr:tail fiber domain-containing protein [Chlorobiota bacterium]